MAAFSSMTFIPQIENVKTLCPLIELERAPSPGEARRCPSVPVETNKTSARQGPTRSMAPMAFIRSFHRIRVCEERRLRRRCSLQRKGEERK
jgi:hypothetical protein